MGRYDEDNWEPPDDEERIRKANAGVCDSDCRGANHCGGHVVCPRCGKVFCPSVERDEDGHCGDCAAYLEDHLCRECGDECEKLNEDGLCESCAALAEEAGKENNDGK